MMLLLILIVSLQLLRGNLENKGKNRSLRVSKAPLPTMGAERTRGPSGHSLHWGILGPLQHLTRWAFPPNSDP